MELSQLARLFIFFKTSREACSEMIQQYMEQATHGQTFQQWLKSQTGFEAATDHDLDEFKKIVYDIPDNII